MHDTSDYGDPKDLPPHSERKGYPFAGEKPLRDQINDVLSDHAQLGTKLQHPTCLDLEYHLAKSLKGEPIFLLRGQDKFAAVLVKLWVNLNELNPDCPPSKLEKARKIALAMEMWPHKKWPD